MSYEKFLDEKIVFDRPSGFEPLPLLDDKYLFPFQKAIVAWACRRGRAALFEDTGLGKTRQQLAWAEQVFQYTGNRVLIFAPLCVAQQTVLEGVQIGVRVRYTRGFDADGDTGIYITNYEMLEHFEPWIAKGYFDGVVLDESSILKSQDGKTRGRLIRACQKIPFRLSCTATPSPNDFMELGNQAEFLGIMSSTEMLATFFVHDGGETSKWRLKGHGRTQFWEWLAQWAVCIRKPSDLGFDDEGYNLPPLEIIEHVVSTGKTLPNAENPTRAQTLSERGTARRITIDDRVDKAAELMNDDHEQWIVWCNLNEESEKLSARISGAIEVRGAHSIDEKESRILSFTRGDVRVMDTKPSIAGFGMNWQHCHKMAFVGLNDSYEQLYQAIRRCYRFGQTKPVQVHLITADLEGAVLDNIKRKEAQAEEMGAAMILHMRDFCRREVRELRRERVEYCRDLALGPDWTLHLGDCVEIARDIPSESVDYSVFSPPFSSLYTYSNSIRDMGNSRNDAEFWKHFGFLVDEYLRVLRPGRLVSIHCMNLPTTKTTHGIIGIRDFRGDLIRRFQAAGFIYHSEVCVWKDPVVAMQRTKALGLLWKQIKKDSAMSRQGIPDYVCTFRKPGENPKPLHHTAEQFPVQEWQQLASPCWMDIRQSNTLNRSGARDEDDERHIAPLQLDLIQRCIRLWSNPGDLVYSPFAGIGSEGYVALKMGRKFIGSELKRSYFDIARKNLDSADRDESWDKSTFRAVKPPPAAPTEELEQGERCESQMTIFDMHSGSLNG